MSKIYGDEFKLEISRLKRLDKKILECKAHTERIRYECNTNKAFENDNVTLKEAIHSLLQLSRKVIDLKDSLTDYENTYSKISNPIIKRLLKNKTDREDFKRMASLRKGAERLTESYSKTLRKFGKKLREERNE
tara:strand:+ start:157 stop:558 length:402 start_codon:yes stop_codon:yes gene_type:complete